MAMTKRSWAALLVVVAWGVALGWLGLRRLGMTDAARISSQAALRLAPGDAWFRIMAGATQLGYGGITLDTLADGTYRIREQLNIELPSDTGIYRAIRSTEYFLAAGLTIDSLVSRYTTARRNERLVATARDGGWDVRLLRPGLPTAAGRLHLEQPSGAPLVPIPLPAVPLRLGLVGAIASGDARTVTVAAGWPPAALGGRATPGSDSTVIFADSSDVDSASGRWVPAALDTVQARVLLLESPIGPRRLLVDRRGTVVSLEEPFGVRWIREDFNVARFNFRQTVDSTGAALRAALPVVRPLLGSGWLADTSGIGRSWRVTRRDGTLGDPSLRTLLNGPRQQFYRQDTLIVRRLASGEREEYRVADPFIQESDSGVVALAAELAPLFERGDDREAMAQIRARVRADTAIAAAPDAAGALREGRATVDGLARLAVAVMRRNGIAARYVTGVMPVGDTMFTHAWVEWDRGRGRRGSLDPVTGRATSIGLIRLGVGGSSYPEDLWLHVADVRFTPVDMTTRQGAGQ